MSKDTGVLDSFVPVFERYGEDRERSGMTLRDDFAGRALTGALASCQSLDLGTDSQRELLAAWCYQMADAMLKERAK